MKKVSKLILITLLLPLGAIALLLGPFVEAFWKGEEDDNSK